MSQIKLLITDFDGTLVDTFYANYMAYKEALSFAGLSLSEERYRECFGFRFDDFMKSLGIYDEPTKDKIREIKGNVYPNYFSHLKVNQPLLEFLRSFKKSGGYTAVASTARKKNLYNALEYIGAKDSFSYILAGEDVTFGKPNPEIYNNVLKHFSVQPSEALVFEDSEVGIRAAMNSQISYIPVSLINI